MSPRESYVGHPDYLTIISFALEPKHATSECYGFKFEIFVVFFNFVGVAGAIEFLAYRLHSLLNHLNSIQAVINGGM